MEKYKSPVGEQLIYDSYQCLLDSWGVDKKEVTIETEYGKTHVVLTGSQNSPNLLLFHGTADDLAMMWIYNIKELSKHFHVIAVDTIGGPGKSEPSGNYYKCFDAALWINQILDFLNIEKTNIAGVSYGAQLAQSFAAKNPDRVNKIVCLSGALPDGKLKSLITMMRVFLPEALFPSEKNVKRLLRKMCGPNIIFLEENRKLMRHWYYLLKYFNNKNMFYHKLPEFESKDIEVLKSKAVYLLGEYDKLVKYSNPFEKLKKYNMAYKIVKNAGHGINHEQPEVINKEIIDFLLV